MATVHRIAELRDLVEQLEVVVLPRGFGRD
jgi:hypothetical protein